MHTEEFTLELSHGVVHTRRWGSADAPLTLCVHGLSANLHAFDYLAERIAGADRQVVAFDLRGRGRSEITSAGSYGLASHAEDVLEMATALGATRFDFVGWSLGALIGITVAGTAADRLRTLTLLDHCNREEPGTYTAVRQALEPAGRGRGPQGDLHRRDPRRRRCHTVEPLLGAALRLRAGTCRGPIRPDHRQGGMPGGPGLPGPGPGDHLLAKITMPALLVRATVGLGGGDAVPKSDRDAIRRIAPNLRVAELDRNHFGIMTDNHTVAAVAELLDQGS